MTIAIEPMITVGGPDVWLARRRLDDLDRPTARCAAHFEHTVAITADGPRILTPRVGIATERAGLLQ